VPGCAWGDAGLSPALRGGSPGGIGLFEDAPPLAVGDQPAAQAREAVDHGASEIKGKLIRFKVKPPGDQIPEIDIVIKYVQYGRLIRLRRVFQVEQCLQSEVAASLPVRCHERLHLGIVHENGPGELLRGEELHQFVGRPALEGSALCGPGIVDPAAG